MPKIAMIGAGSMVFCKTLSMDILATPSLRDSEIRLMSRTKPKLDQMQSFLVRVIKDNQLPATVWNTLDRRRALEGADYVIVMIQVGGLGAFKYDYEIPLRYGVDQCIGDSLGPGGIFRGLRTIPVLAEIAREMDELCPEALLLNYANPMAGCCYALGKIARKIQFVGLCHGVQTTLDLISRYVNTPKDQIDYLCAGINHMAWFLSLRDKKTQQNLYPVLRKNIERPEYYANEKVRCEVMRHFGYFMTESTGHLSEYLPWFRSSQRALDLYCDEPAFGGETGAYYRYSSRLAEKYKDVNYLESEKATLGQPSVEYCSHILEACETNRTFRFNGNVRNDDYILNLPSGCCVEIPVKVDKQGLQPEPVGTLPPQLAALNQSNVTVQTLMVEAALTGDPEHIVHAMAMDPLTSACCTLHEIREMAIEMLEKQREWLPEFSGKHLLSKPTIVIPPNTGRVEVPLDPALAIANRFAELAERQVQQKGDKPVD